MTVVLNGAVILGLFVRVNMCPLSGECVCVCVVSTFSLVNSCFCPFLPGVLVILCFAPARLFPPEWHP